MIRVISVGSSPVVASAWVPGHDRLDEGIWETRGTGRKDFTYGRFQTWVALDRWTDVPGAGRVTPAGTLRS